MIKTGRTKRGWQSPLASLVEFRIAIAGASILTLAEENMILRAAMFSLLTLVLAYEFFLWSYKRPFFDPDPKGNGSFKEVNAITKQFRDFYRTNDKKNLPEGFIWLKGYGEDGSADSWMVYYATASHSKIRGGTIVLMDSSGRIDVYFGHHCSTVDGGTVILSSSGLSIWSLDSFYERIDDVRRAFEKSFHHQRTEHAAASDGDKPPN